MISTLGTGLVLGSLGFASAGSALGFWAGARSHLHAWTWSRVCAWGFALTMVAANLVMVWALVTHDFSVKYVTEVGSLSTPWHIAVISLWSSLNGSILFWGGVLGLYVLAFLAVEGKSHRAYAPWTLGVLMAIAVFFSLIVGSIANPFAAVNPIPLDGPGPNPLLQNHWLMAVHPPTLYLGYVGMSVPFAMICAALFAGRLDAGWMVPLRRWMLIPWTFLTCGIVLGGWWSYEVLGWGGAWAWDPVENASFHPWLTGTAFLHSAMVMQRRGDLRVWTLVLGMATFVLTLVGTFMTRSGVFNSVHSFTQSAIGPVFLWFIAIVLVFSIVLLALREHTLAVESGDPGAETTLMKQVFGRSLHPLGREFAIMAQNAVFTVFTFTVLLGTLMPLLAEAWDGRKVSVGEPYFDRWALPLGLMIVFLMGVGPALPWGKLSWRKAAERLGIPLIAGAVFTAPFALAGFTKTWTMVSIFLVGYAGWTNLNEFFVPLRARMRSKGENPLEAGRRVLTRSRRRFGGHLAHIGVLLAVISLALSRGFKEETDVTLAPGESTTVAGYDVTFTDTRMDQLPHRTSVIAAFDVASAGRTVGRLEPMLNYYPTQREPIYTPAVHTTLGGDLYLSVRELDSKGSYVILRIITMPGVVWLWIAPLLISLGSLMVLWPTRRTAAASMEQRA